MAWCSVKKKHRDNFTFTFSGHAPDTQEGRVVRPSPPRIMPPFFAASFTVMIYYGCIAMLQGSFTIYRVYLS